METRPVFYAPSQIMSLTITGADIKETVRSFYEELTTLIKDYADPEATLVVDGIPLVGAEKYTSYGAMLIDDKVAKLENSQTTLFNVFDMIFRLERTLSQIS